MEFWSGRSSLLRLSQKRLLEEKFLKWTKKEKPQAKMILLKMKSSMIFVKGNQLIKVPMLMSQTNS